jgi:excisionase family DNA binding protein
VATSSNPSAPSTGVRSTEAGAARHAGLGDPSALVESLIGPAVHELPMLLTPEQAAAFLGIPRSTVYAMLRSGELPSRTVKRTKRISRPELVLWLIESDR